MSFFKMTNNEQRSVAGFIVLVLGVLLTKMYFGSISETTRLMADEKEVQIPKTIEVSSAQKTNTSIKINEEKRKPRKLSFPAKKIDPNEMDIGDWETMGFSLKKSIAIKNYITAIGVIDNKNQIKNIYVLNEFEKEEIIKHIKLVRIDINVALESHFMKVPGIGEKLSQRIVKYRGLLGGFSSVDQLNEVYGLDSTVVKRITSRFQFEGSVKKIMINKASFSTLSKHPYISKKIAKELIKVRSSERINEKSQLFEVFSNEEVFLKIEPYISYE